MPRQGLPGLTGLALGAVLNEVMEPEVGGRVGGHSGVQFPFPSSFKVWLQTHLYFLQFSTAYIAREPSKVTPVGDLLFELVL